jgi:hypothetical protein
MNGFIVLGEGSREFRKLSEIAPVGEGESSQHQSVGKDCLLTWGRTHGDIQCAVRGNESFVVLSGYILEVKNHAEFSNQRDVAGFLLQTLDSAASDDAIRQLLERLYGSFGIFYRNAERDETICISDRVASRPLWCKWNSPGWVVSSHPTAIAMGTANTSLDLAGLGAFLL